MLLIAACGSQSEDDAGNPTQVSGGEVTEITVTAEPDPAPTASDVPIPDISSISAVSELESTGTIRIALLYEDPAFIRAMDIFNGKYPGWEVEITPLTEPVEDVDAEGNTYIWHRDKYIDTMAMLERNEVDVVNTLWYNTGEFLQSKQLEDLAVMFQDDVDYNMNRLLPNLRGLLMTGDGRLPLLPVSFESMVIYPKEGMTIHQSDEIPKEWTWYEMLDWFEDDFKTNGVEYMFYESCFNFMENNMLLEYMHYIYNYVTEEPDFYSPVLENIAKLTKHLLDNGKLTGIHWKDLDPSGEGIWYEEDFTDYLLTYFNLEENVVDYSTLMTGYGQAYPYPYVDGTEGKSVRLNNSFGINSNSSASVKRAAWELLKILISDEIQNGGLLRGSSVVSELTREGVARNLYAQQFTEATEERAEEMIDSVTQEELDKYNNDRMTYFDDISQLYYRTPDYLESQIFQRFIPYFRGNSTFEECVEYLTTTYFQRNAGFTGDEVGDSKLQQFLDKQKGED
jgi:ABC-type glycerol-3-phosphate transport system substrate-binding protein